MALSHNHYQLWSFSRRKN